MKMLKLTSLRQSLCTAACLTTMLSVICLQAVLEDDGLYCVSCGLLTAAYASAGASGCGGGAARWRGCLWGAGARRVCPASSDWRCARPWTALWWHSPAAPSVCPAWAL